MLLSHSTWGMPKVDIDTAVEHCASVGFDGLEVTIRPGWTTDAAHLDSRERHRIRTLFDDHGLILNGFAGHTGFSVSDPDQWQANLATFKSYLDCASDMQRPGECQAVATTSGGRPGEWDELKDRLVERFGIVAHYGHQRGIEVAAEAHVSNAMRTPEQVKWLVEQVGSPALKVHFDISHFNVQGMDMEAVVAELAPLCSTTHVKDERGVVPDFEFLVPGEGSMDYVKYLKAMQRARYQGHITVEISVMVQARTDYDPLATATESYRVLSRAFEEAGISRA